MEKLMKNETWLAFTTRDFTEKELQNLKARKFLPRTIPIAYDGLAIIVNNSNPDTLITVKDFARILSGEVKEWKEVYPNSKLGEFDVEFCLDYLKGTKFNFKTKVVQRDIVLESILQSCGSLVGFFKFFILSFT